MSTPRSSVELIALLLKSSYKLIFFCTQEEGRAELALQGIAKGRDGFTPREYFCWTETEGFLSQDGRQPEGAKKTADPVGALQWIIDRERKQTPPRTICDERPTSFH